MIRTTAIALAMVAFVSGAYAQPMKLDNAQLDRVTGGGPPGIAIAVGHVPTLAQNPNPPPFFPPGLANALPTAPCLPVINTLSGQYGG